MGQTLLGRPVSQQTGFATLNTPSSPFAPKPQAPASPIAPISQVAQFPPIGNLVAPISTLGGSRMGFNNGSRMWGGTPIGRQQNG